MVFPYGALPVYAMSFEKKFGRNVRYWRKRRGLSQEEFAHRAQLHPTYVSGIETGYRNPTVRIVGRIAAALDVEPAILFGEVEGEAAHVDPVPADPVPVDRRR